MIVYVLISTDSFSATCSDPETGLTLNPIIMALDADASNTSDSVIAPTPQCITLIETYSLDIFYNDCFTACTDP